MLFSTAESHEIIAQRLGVDDRTLWFAEIDPGVAYRELATVRPCKMVYLFQW